MNNAIRYLKRKGYRLLAGILVAAAVLILAGSIFKTADRSPQSSLVSAASATSSIADQAGFKRASGPTQMEFPADFGPHPNYQTEWWYYTGNLETAEGRHFGFQLTFFRRALRPPADLQQRSSAWAVSQVYMAHFALTDTAARQHHAFERLARGSAGLAGAQGYPYRVWLQDWHVEQSGPDQYQLYARQDDLEVDLTLTDLKGPILNGVDGYSQKGPDPGNASYYYSQTRLQTQGRITSGGSEFAVSGLSWKDHEYSTSALAEGQIGWDWFSIQLDNQTELMVFQLRREDRVIDPYSSGTLVAADGSTRHLFEKDFEIEVLGSWQSPENEAVYPARWNLRVPSASIELEIIPHLADQEMNLSYAYWEGAVLVNGQYAGQPVTGHGYVELSGYAGSLSGEF